MKRALDDSYISGVKGDPGQNELRHNSEAGSDLHDGQRPGDSSNYSSIDPYASSQLRESDEARRRKRDVEIYDQYGGSPNVHPLSVQNTLLALANQPIVTFPSGTPSVFASQEPSLFLPSPWGGAQGDTPISPETLDKRQKGQIYNIKKCFDRAHNGKDLRRLIRSFNRANETSEICVDWNRDLCSNASFVHEAEEGQELVHACNDCHEIFGYLARHRAGDPKCPLSPIL